MTRNHLAVTFAAVALTAAPALAQNKAANPENSTTTNESLIEKMQTGGDSSSGASAPGHQMQNEQGQSTGPRASEDSPGHQATDKDNSSSSTGTGAGTAGSKSK